MESHVFWAFHIAPFDAGHPRQNGRYSRLTWKTLVLLDVQVLGERILSERYNAGFKRCNREGEQREIRISGSNFEKLGHQLDFGQV